MPRFTDTERETIQKALMDEGQRLFALHGLKKVTVDDLTAAANISKGSFYAFFQNKEHLFVTINFRLQEQLFQELRGYLEEHRGLPAKELAAAFFLHFFQRAMEYPILPEIDAAVMAHVQRKLPPELFEAHTLDDAAFVKVLGGYGIHFRQDPLLIAKALQNLYGCACNLAGSPDFHQVMTILVDGVVNQVE